VITVPAYCGRGFAAAVTVGDGVGLEAPQSASRVDRREEPRIVLGQQLLLLPGGFYRRGAGAAAKG